MPATAIGARPDQGRVTAPLALTILLAVTDAATVERFFKWGVIAPIEADRWALDCRRRRGRTMRSPARVAPEGAHPSPAAPPDAARHPYR